MERGRLVTILVAILLSALVIGTTWVAVFRRPPTQREEVFDLEQGRSQPLIVGKAEVILELVSASPEGSMITCSVDGETTTKEYKVGDVVVELPEGKIVLERHEITEFSPVVCLRVSGNFEMKY